MGEFGGIISAAIVYRGCKEDCEAVAAAIEAAYDDVPTRIECEGHSWTVLVPFADDPRGRAAVREAVSSGTVRTGG